MGITGRIPFVATIIALLGCGLVSTLLLTTRAAEDSYKLADARRHNQQLANERAVLQREVEKADAAPELAARAAKLGMVPVKDPAHLVVAVDGSVTVVGKPKAAQGLPAPQFNPIVPPGGVLPNTIPGWPNLGPTSTLPPGTDVRALGEQSVPVPIGTVGVALTASPSGSTGTNPAAAMPSDRR